MPWLGLFYGNRGDRIIAGEQLRHGRTPYAAAGVRDGAVVLIQGRGRATSGGALKFELDSARACGRAQWEGRETRRGGGSLRSSAGARSGCGRRYGDTRRGAERGVVLEFEHACAKLRLREPEDELVLDSGRLGAAELRRWRARMQHCG